jgi:hypothetical protein
VRKNIGRWLIHSALASCGRFCSASRLITTEWPTERQRLNLKMQTTPHEAVTGTTQTDKETKKKGCHPWQVLAAQ